MRWHVDRLADELRRSAGSADVNVKGFSPTRAAYASEAQRATSGPQCYAKKFSGPYSRRTIEEDIGHNLLREAPDAFADAVLGASGGAR